MASNMDNINPDAIIPPSPREDVDEYVGRFEVLEKLNAEGNAVLRSIDNQPNDQQRLYTAINYIKVQQKHNEELYELLVDMNNYFGSK